VADGFAKHGGGRDAVLVLVALEDLVAGLAGYVELPAGYGHFSAVEEAGDEAGRSSSLEHFCKRILRLPAKPSSVTYVPE
jgi:hypothetical protein